MEQVTAQEIKEINLAIRKKDLLIRERRTGDIVKSMRSVKRKDKRKYRFTFENKQNSSPMTLVELREQFQLMLDSSVVL